MKRTCIVELVVDEETEKRLKQLCDLSSKLWNEVNYIRLRMWLEKKGIDFDGTYKEFYEKYKPLISRRGACLINVDHLYPILLRDLSNPSQQKAIQTLTLLKSPFSCAMPFG